jgi:hypothetical protein
MKLAKEWLTKCLSTHARCQNSLETQLPTRVIDLGMDGESPSLFVTKGVSGRYVTLSHCWGKATFLTTTGSTLATRIAGIAIADLPKTFQHAIRVTHLLGFKYLRIDSLCIVQDSKQDWRVESSKMQNVYERAILNISADAAPDSTWGLGMKERLPSGVVVGTTRNCDHVYVRPAFGQASSSPSHWPCQRDISRQILNTRA